MTEATESAERPQIGGEAPISAPARVKVLFPMPLPKAYDYLSDTPAPPGAWVVAPFGEGSLRWASSGPANPMRVAAEVEGKASARAESVRDFPRPIGVGLHS